MIKTRFRLDLWEEDATQLNRRRLTRLSKDVDMPYKLNKEDVVRITARPDMDSEIDAIGLWLTVDFLMLDITLGVLIADLAEKKRRTK